MIHPMRRFTLVGALLVMLGTTATADTIFVPLQQPTVADAVAGAGPGDTIVVVASAPGGGRATARPGIRIVGAPEAYVRGSLELTGHGLRIHRVSFRNADVRLTGDRALVRRCRFDGERGTGVRIRGRRATVSGSRFQQRRATAISIQGPSARVVRNSIDMRRLGRRSIRLPAQASGGIEVDGDRARVRGNRLVAIERTLVLRGDDARVLRNMTEASIDGFLVRGARALIDDNLLHQDGFGIDVLGDTPVVTNNDVRNFGLFGFGGGPGIRVHSDSPGGQVRRNTVQQHQRGFDLRLCGAEIGSIYHGEVDTFSLEPSVLLVGDDNRLDGMSSQTTYARTLRVVGSRNEIIGVFATSGSNLRTPAILVEGDHNTLRDLDVGARGGGGVAVTGDDNEVNGGSVEVWFGTCVQISGHRNRVASIAARLRNYLGAPSAAIVIASGTGNIVTECEARAEDHRDSGLSNAATATVVRGCTLLSGVNSPDDAPEGQSVRNSGDFAVFEDNVLTVVE